MPQLFNKLFLLLNYHLQVSGSKQTCQAPTSTNTKASSSYSKTTLSASESRIYLQKLLLPNNHLLLSNHPQLLNLPMPSKHLLLTNQTHLQPLHQPRNITHLCLLLNCQPQIQKVLLPSNHILLKTVTQLLLLPLLNNQSPHLPLNQPHLLKLVL